MKRNLNKNKKLIIVLIIILLFILSLFMNRNYTYFEQVLKDTSIIIQKVVMMPFVNLKVEKNTDASESYLIQKNVNSSLEKEIQELKAELELKKTLTEYDTVCATILSRNKSYWFNTITIDKGKSSGIEIGDAVITKNGLVGKITKLSKFSSDVKLITSDDINFKVSVSIKTNEVDNYAILNGYDKKTGFIKASGIDKTTPVNVGDTVLTSGLGSNYPGGIYVGEIKKVTSDKYNLSKIVYIKTSQNFNDIHYVTVLRNKK